MSATELNEFLTAMDIVRNANTAALSNASALSLEDTILDNDSDWFDTPVALTAH
jgi:hypothetical protein